MIAPAARTNTAGAASATPFVAVFAALAAFAMVAAAQEQTPGKPDLDRALQLSQAAIGRPLGDYVLQDRLHRPVRIADYRGKPLVISFVYTSCFEVCPTGTQFLARAVRSARAALGEASFNVLTVGFNQPFDAPDAMAAFARQNGISDAAWEFVGADQKVVQSLTADLGFTYYRTPRGFDHLIQVSVVDAEGVVFTQIYGDTFELPMLVSPLKDLLSGTAVRRGGYDGLWNKVKLFCTVYDPATGQYRFSYTIFVELFAGLTFLGALGFVYIRERRRSQRAGLLD
jgi:protein SCO1/2